MADSQNQENKKHRATHSGRKAEKKKLKLQNDANARQRNPKAFAVNSVEKAARRFRRTMDIKEKKHHIPLVDRTPLEPPPIIVAIVGPPKVGKTTLLRCLVKNFTRQNLSNVKGPVTIVSGKKRRLTLIECNNDINNMVDIAKVADLVLLLVDASFGFEMETFEFLNICQVHGFPRIMGVLTHLDSFKNMKSLKKTKKQMKHRFWTEIYQGAKVFYLSGMIRGAYLKTEVHNLARFISVMKFRPLQWRTTHPYILVDRVEDITDPILIQKNPVCDRTVCLYGYARGAPLRKNSQAHIPGCGDFSIKDISLLPDPCPLPDKEKRRSLNEKERLTYAPFSGVGGIVYDKDAVYIELGGSHSSEQSKKNLKQQSQEITTVLANTKHLEKNEAICEDLSLFSTAKPLTAKDIESLSCEEIINEDETESSVEKDNINDKKMLKNYNEDSLKIERHQESEDDEMETSSNDDDDEDRESNIDDEEMQSDTDDEEMQNDTDNEEMQNDTDDDEMKSDAGEEEDGEDESEVQVKTPLLKPCLVEGKIPENKDSNENFVFADSEDDLEMDKKEKYNIPKSVELEKDEGQSFLKKETTEQKSEDISLSKSVLEQKVIDAFYQQQQNPITLRNLVYGSDLLGEQFEDNRSDDDNDYLLREVKSYSHTPTVYSLNGNDSSKMDIIMVRKWLKPEEQDSIRDMFVTGKWSQEDDAGALLEKDEALYGDFEDLETGEIHCEKKTKDSRNKDDDNSEFDSEKEENPNKEDENSSNEKELNEKKDGKTLQEKRIEKKLRLKEMFNSEYDEKDGKSYYDTLKSELDQQAQLNKSEFSNMEDNVRAQYEGYRAGMYLRIEIDNMPCEFMTNFDPTYPVIVGGLLGGEDIMGYVQVRLKKHRWYSRILKTRDPLIISLGWRRCQVIPLFSVQDHNGRQRLLKYTPQHLHCYASFWGPVTPQGTGMIAVQSVSETKSNFRVAATGVVLDLDKSTDIVKKLKLIGTPFKIYKKTAFIKGMFHSALEIAKFEGAAIRTVSGIRGQIKKAIRAPEGGFRATFEDRILLSDIVFLRTWFTVSVPQFCTTVASLLLPPEEKTKWQGMKTVGQLRFEHGLSAPVCEDSLYTPIERKPRYFAPLTIPKELQKNLPYRFKPKFDPVKKTPSIESKRVAVILEPHEREIANMLKTMTTVHEDKKRKEHVAMWQRAKAHRKEKRGIEARREQREKELKKRIFRIVGKVKRKR